MRFAGIRTPSRNRFVGLTADASCQSRRRRHCRRFRQRMAGTVGMDVPVDPPYSRFITDRSAFLHATPSQILRNSAVTGRWV